MSATGFVERVYRVVRRIPRGKVASYGQVAAIAGNPLAARAVGMAMRDVPEELKLPCHRVIRSDGMLASKWVFGGKQREMLVREGVKFLANGRVDLARSGWRGGRS